MITSKLQEAELEKDKYKNAINKVADIMSWDDYDIEEKYWQIYEYVNSIIHGSHNRYPETDGEPITADEFNKGDDVEYNYDK